MANSSETSLPGDALRSHGHGQYLASNPLDRTNPEADPVEGWEVGHCQIIRRLKSGSAKSLLAMRTDPREGTALVVLRSLDVPGSKLEELREHARWAARLRHPNLGRVYECETSEEGGTYWVTEFASGASLAELIAACKKNGKGVPVGLALSAVHEAALALGELHQAGGRAHGFISDHSVFVSFDGQTKLVDLGLFRTIDGKILHPDGLADMAAFLAPEQVVSGRMPDPRSDVFALAALLHECLSGQKPPSGFDATPNFAPPSSFNISLRGELDAVVLRALDPKRSQRFANAAEFAQKLKSAASEFMWKAPPRAEFVGRLFQNRKRREQVLLQGCEEIVWAPPKSAADAEPEPAPEPISDVSVEITVESAERASSPQLSSPLPALLPPAPSAAVRASRQHVGMGGAPRPAQPRSAFGPVAVAGLAVLLVIGGVGFVTLREAPPAPAPVVKQAQALPAAVIAMGAAPIGPPPEGEFVGPMPADAAPALDAEGDEAADKLRAAKIARWKAILAKKKAAKGEGPLPPWLMPKKKR